MSPLSGSGGPAMGATEVATFAGALALQLVSRCITLPSADWAAPVGSKDVVVSAA
jgi:hypothetical protein